MTKQSAKRILVVEDDDVLREIISRILREKGYKIEEAVNGQRGIALYRKNPPDLVLLDIILPDIDGFDVLAAFKEQEEKLACPVIILSNYGQAPDIKRGRELGATDYLIKANLSPKEIVARIQKALQ